MLKRQRASGVAWPYIENISTTKRNFVLFWSLLVNRLMFCWTEIYIYRFCPYTYKTVLQHQFRQCVASHSILRTIAFYSSPYSIPLIRCPACVQLTVLDKSRGKSRPHDPFTHNFLDVQNTR